MAHPYCLGLLQLTLRSVSFCSFLPLYGFVMFDIVGQYQFNQTTWIKPMYNTCPAPNGQILLATLNITQHLEAKEPDISLICAYTVVLNSLKMLPLCIHKCWD